MQKKDKSLAVTLFRGSSNTFNKSGVNNSKHTDTPINPQYFSQLNQTGAALRIRKAEPFRSDIRGSLQTTWKLSLALQWPIPK